MISEKSEKTIYRIFQNFEDPSFIMDRKGQIIECNKSLAAMFGRTVEETLDGNIYDIIPPELTSSRKIQAEKVFTTGERQLFEDEHLGRFLRHSVYPITGDDGSVLSIFIIAQDITDLKRAETELKIARNTVKRQKIFSDALIDAVPGAFFMLDARGCYVLWNDFQRDIVAGKPESEMPKTFAIETIHPDDKKVVLEQLNNILANGGEKTLEVRAIMHEKPGYRWFQISGKRILIDEEPFIIGIGIDIDARKNADITTLKKSEERFRKLFEENSLINLLIDPESGRIIDANRAAADFYGWSVTELREKFIRELSLLSEDKSRDVLHKALNGENKVFQCRHRIADETLREVEVHTNTLEIDAQELLYISLYDITERKIDENKLKILSIAVQQSPTIVMITDPLGNIEYTNPMFTGITGYTAEEVRGKNPRFLQSGLTPGTVYKNLWTTILAGSYWQGEFLNRKKDGSLYWENAFIAPMRNEKGETTNFVAVKEDITEKKKLWNELVDAKDKAEESDRLKSAFLTNMSHEIRTPMNGIIGLTELLKETDFSAVEQHEYIELIQKSGERMMKLIDDIIDTSRVDAKKTTLNIAETSVNTILRDIYVFFLPEAKKKMLSLNLHEGLPDNESLIMTDPRKFEQIVTNLVHNALKFTKQGHIDFGYSKKEGELEFYVTDTGSGIHADMKEKIFERFWQADSSLSRSQEGAGLGLSIVKAFTEMLGGMVHFESNEDGGSRFMFTLPYRLPENVSISGGTMQTAHTRSTEKCRQAETIIIVEHDEATSLLLEKKLKDENFRIIFARNGKEALELTSAHPEAVLVLLDISMPVMNGFEAARMIKQMRPSVPVIFQSEFFSPGNRRKAIEAGADGFITKPFSKYELFEKIRNLSDTKKQNECLLNNCSPGHER
ncbi:MAG: PAS domain S-box protein [Chlorobiaceae bacterium]|nr:PAS domain S-box protein [Chlorobiaceae bacterium]